MRFVECTPINGQSGGADYNSAAIDSSYLMSVSAQAILSGVTAPAGTVKLQFSNDSANPSNWSDIPSATVSTNSNAVFAIAKTDLAYRWIRAVYLHSTSSTGTVTVNLNAIGF